MRYLNVILGIFLMLAKSNGQNPIIQTCYTPDPGPMVYKDRVYLYTGHDEDNSTYITMNEWRVYSSTDMINWTDHGSPLSYKDFSWTQSNSAWAAQCVERNGKFYWYVCCEYPRNWHAIGVAVSESNQVFAVISEYLDGHI